MRGLVVLVAIATLVVWVVQVRERPVPATVEQARELYLAEEGHVNRGARFSELVGWMDDCWDYGLGKKLLFGGQYGQRTILDILGPPDLYAGDLEGGNCNLVYFHDRFGERDWVVYVDIWSGRLVEVGYNDSSVNDHSRYTPYPGAPAQPEQEPDSAPRLRQR